MSNTELAELVELVQELRTAVQKLDVKVSTVDTNLQTGISMLTLRLESIFTSSGKKAVKTVTRNTKKSDAKCKYSNTMHWFVGMYMEDNKSVLDKIPSGVKASAQKKVDESKKLKSANVKKMVASAIWKSFDKSTKDNTFKPMYKRYVEEYQKANVETKVAEPTSE